MVLTPVNTEKVPGRISYVYIGTTSATGISITSGIKSFSYRRIHDATPKFTANTKTGATAFQPHSHYEWTLEFISDCRAAFFATDVDNDTGGAQYAIDPNGDSEIIDYFCVIVPILDTAGASKTRTYTISNGYCTKNSAYIGDDEDAIYTYEGLAEEITYADA